MNIINLIKEEYNNILDEDYPSSFDMDYFKKITSFNKRIEYCEEQLQRISSGSSRIVYKIDDEKVLKLARNKKGLAQNEVEISQGNDYYLEQSGILAKVFDSDENDLWVEMEFAEKMKVSDFKRIIGIDFIFFGEFIENYYISLDQRRSRNKIIKNYSDEINDMMWENEFVSGILDYIGNYDVVVGDLKKLSTYGIVKRNSEDTVVIIDFGLTGDVYDNYYT
jgi:mRNA-degrading endonuclease RelE of RelBE toxin-antitoxin system